MKRLAGFLLLIVLAACTPAPTGPEERDIDGDWERLPKSPLSARYGSHSVTINGKLLVVGGTDTEPCGGDCTTPTEAPFSDGAVYDPSNQTWSKIADAPVPIGHATSTVIDGRAFFLVGDFTSTHRSVRRAFVSYDPNNDQWQEHGLPPNDRWRILASSAGTVVAFQASQENGVQEDFIYDPATDRWSRLPPDPLQPSYDRWMVGTDAGLVLTAISTEPREPDEPNLYQAALLAENKWKVFGESQIIGYNPEWSWAGGTVLNPSNERADGGETNNWGETYNAGGTLDPATGEWGLLPNPPHGRGEFEGFSAAGDRYAIAYSGWVYDALDEQWIELVRPEGAPEVDMSATWLDNTLYIFGGVRWEGSDPVILDDAWMWSPGGYE